jgi:hypothetical protein
MANTYNLIASNTLSSSAASVTFSAIPNTYTDLVLRLSVRTTETTTESGYYIQFNSDTASNYSRVYLRGDGSTADSGVAGNATSATITVGATGDSATANTFSNNEHYIPSYTQSVNKPFGSSTRNETNASAAYLLAHANLWRNNATISSITITANGTNWKSGSSFYLYGIKNS